MQPATEEQTETEPTDQSAIEQEKTETASTEIQTEAVKSVKTGDNTPIGRYLLLEVLAAFFLAAG